MRWVQTAAVRPHRCACVPYIGGAHPEGFFDFGTEIMAFDGHVYVSGVAARMMAEAMGWAPAGADRSAEKLAKVTAELEQTTAQVAELQAQLEAIQVLKNTGFVQQKAPGRPRKVA